VRPVRLVLGFLVAIAALPACKSALGEACKADDDCRSGLICCPPNGRGVCEDAAEECDSSSGGGSGGGTGGGSGGGAGGGAGDDAGPTSDAGGDAG
jgi:hypothetical protein